ncbi:DUF4335 domain-containing protein [Cylindrospermum sp. FACHB-282]|uniref:DUF4335 domain-containing protein n=1 Tax=Cylindrospermum sp. FACHB-282 TaxID=2692794 RepID=UPI001683CD63|nr:DUF4335 domain-containing protein [Cylindrospermum sp. FACHB-282]MBD2385429.1 DUF4335 domain-containing protein [Cylindrospermum sp. FACHB-282]
MPRLNSVIRRYTPPTCTLEVSAQSSPLSRWMGKTVLKQLSFELRFDDPRLPEEHRVTIRGDRDQLEALCDAVTNYVQELLQQSPENFWVSFSGLQESSAASDESKLPEDFSPTSLSAKRLELVPEQMPGAYIHLEPSNYFTHNLFLGSLSSRRQGNTNQTSIPAIQLTLLQLFDLATALDEYSTDVMTLPTVNSPSYSQRLPAWAPVAAVLVLSVGLTPLTWQYASHIRQKQQQIAKTAAPAPKIASQPLTENSFPAPQPGITPPDNLRSLPLLGATPPLPTSSLPQAPLSFPNSTFPATAKTVPRDSLNIPQTQNPTNPQFAVPPTRTNSQVAFQQNSQQKPTGLNPQRETALPRGQNLPNSKAKISPQISTLPASIATIPNNPGNIPIPAYSPLDPQQLEREINSPPTTASVTGDENPLVEKLRAGSKKPISTEVATNSTLFDTIQVAEAREYLKQRWQPPAGLSQTLEYSLMLGVDGSVERILPLNQAARQYVDSAGIPDIGKPFVSNNKYGQNVRIRVVLSPDGKVQTFSESQ